jgi:hypothetical protein
MFVRAVRYWKEWLSLSREEQQESKFENVNNPLTMLSTIV